MSYMPIFKRKNTIEETNEKRPLKEIALFLVDILYNAVIIIILVVLIRSFLISPFRVIGSSMADSLLNNEFILIDKLSYNLGDPKRGDPVVFLPPITNKYSPKFEELITTDGSGIGAFDIGDSRTKKNVFYCQNPWIQKLWFCQDKVEANDLVYFRPIRDMEGETVIDLNWKNAQKKLITPQEIEQDELIISGESNQSYLIRIYNPTGPEYFVKRIIGIPGDTIRIENGRVYIKTAAMDEFEELDEAYLTDVNQYNTYFKKVPGVNEFKIPEGNYFVLGDNRSHSNDSRHWFSPIDENYTPYVSYDNISGKVLIVLWPPENIRLIPSGALEQTEY